MLPVPTIHDRWIQLWLALLVGILSVVLVICPDIPLRLIGLLLGIITFELILDAVGQ